MGVEIAALVSKCRYRGHVFLQTKMGSGGWREKDNVGCLCSGDDGYGGTTGLRAAEANRRGDGGGWDGEEEGECEWEWVIEFRAIPGLAPGMRRPPQRLEEVGKYKKYVGSRNLRPVVGGILA